MRVVIAEDPALFHAGLARLLQGERFGVYGHVVDGTDTLSLVADTQPDTRSMRRWAIRCFSKAHLAAYRVSGGRVLGSVAGMPVLLLTTTGRRSGKARTTRSRTFGTGPTSW